eukprot:tig00021617_g22949.t1
MSGGEARSAAARNAAAMLLQNAAAAPRELEARMSELTLHGRHDENSSSSTKAAAPAVVSRASESAQPAQEAPAPPPATSSSLDEMGPVFDVPFDEVKRTERRRFGYGSFADVFRATWRGHEVAVKVVRMADIESPKDITDFEREVRIMSSIRHPNVVRCYGGNVKEPKLFLLMELCSRGSLKKYLDDGKFVLEPWLVARVALGVARAVAAMHARSPPVLHRDLKCDNVMLTEDWTPKLADFGFTIELEGRRVFTPCGTYQHIAPEVMREEKADEKVDVYSYGLMLYELLTRQLPYEEFGLAPAVLGARVARTGLRPTLNAEVCPYPQFIPLIEQCWAESPVLRPPFSEIVPRVEALVADLLESTAPRDPPAP